MTKFLKLFSLGVVKIHLILRSTEIPDLGKIVILILNSFILNRYHYKERYDYRRNLTDWDYQMGLKAQAPIVHFYHYREWRMTGVAFESRSCSYVISNRSLSSYLQGKKK